MDLLWVEIRRSPAKWWSLASGVVLGAYLIVSQQQWIGIWPQASMSAQVGAGLAMPFMTAAAAWVGLWRSRARLQKQATVGACNPWIREASPLLAVLVWAYIPVVLGGVGIAIVNYSATNSGHLWPTFLWLALITTLLGVSIGYLAGRLLPSPVTVAATALLMFILIFLGETNDRLALMTYYGYPDEVISWPALAARAALALSFLLAALSAGAISDWASTRTFASATGWRIVIEGTLNRFLFTQLPLRPELRHHRGKLAAIEGPLNMSLIVVSTISIYAAGPLQGERQSYGNVVCTDTYPTVCLWPEHETYLPLMSDYVERFNELDEFLVLPDDPYKGIDEFWESGTRNDTDQLTMFGGDFGAASSMVEYAIWATEFPGCHVETEHDEYESLDDAYWQIVDWFTLYIMDVDSLSTLDVFVPGIDALEPVLQLPRDEQFQWARETVEQLKSPCDA